MYNPADYEAMDESNSVDAIQKALDDNRFKLLFQPIINLRGEGEEHYEAFVRMLNKDNEEVSPYDFLPPVGPSEMAIKIDRWVILQTIKQLSSHRSRGARYPPVPERDGRDPGRQNLYPLAERGPEGSSPAGRLTDLPDTRR